MNILSALGIAGALLLGASAPALAQPYPVDPGYDQGPAYGADPAEEEPEYGPPGPPVEVLPPGRRYVVPGPAYGGGYAGPGPYREDDEVLGGQDGYPVYREEQPRIYRRSEGADDRRGERLRREGEVRRPDGYRWPDEDFGKQRQLRDRHVEQQRRRLPRGDEGMPDAQ